MIGIKKEPSIKVGLVSGARSVRLTLSGRFAAGKEPVIAGDYTASIIDNAVRLEGPAVIESTLLALAPMDFDACRFTVHDVTIGIDFHWQRKESQSFQGGLALAAGPDGVMVINELPLESYLVSVISSEMSASCPAELLRAHAIVSRSWLLAQLAKSSSAESAQQASQAISARLNDSSITAGSLDEMIRWYDRESHASFDVCADDHCQRYQGITKAHSQSAFDAARDTRGVVLLFNEQICDARYSKSCGGMTEAYSAAWEDKDAPYLKAVYDGPGELTGYALPLDVESNAERWINSSPPAYCNATSPELLARILSGFDQETRDFYRWAVTYSQDEMAEILRSRVGVDFGRIIALEPVLRGKSSRLVKLKITGEKKTLVIGKELEIRRALSRSHLYSSAFIVQAEPDLQSQYPARFRLVGAGWGHGVGLCQIGAAVMADTGRSHREILAHYFRGARLSELY